MLICNFTAAVGCLTSGSNENALPDFLVDMEQELKMSAVAMVATIEDSFVK